MKNSHLIVTFLFFVIGVSAKATNPNEKTTPTTETSQEVKSNVVIFKIIPTPSNTNDNSGNAPSSSSGSLKNAGKVARTSYCHSLENIIYKKKGI
ncbi:MAG TPA: hypothetical protein VFF27_04545 [Bacteroidia bacterium]|jgi:hypothetical protein|nr:hypothetical protein [Bacteroidia bacterium]